MFHSFKLCIFREIVGAEFFKSFKNLFFRRKKKAPTIFFKNSIQYTFYDLLKVCKVLKKFTEANTRKIDTKFACKNPHFDFHAGQFTRDIIFQKSRHAKAIHAQRPVLLSYFHAWIKLGQLTGEIGTAHGGK